jgi:hypothetical protein
MRIQSEHEKRNMYLVQLRDAYMSNIFQAYENEQKEILYRLIQENTHAVRNDPDTLVGSYISRSFMYKGEFYRNNSYPQPSDNRIIHPSMMKKIVAFMDKKDFNLEEQRQRIQNYIINVLLFAKHSYDVDELIPSKFRSNWYNITSLFNIGSPATPEELDKFRFNNKAGLVEFKRMFLEELLMA